MNLRQAQKLESEYLLDLYTTIRMPCVMERGQGAMLWDSQGKEYLDLISGGRAVTALGHCHPKVVAAIEEQAGKLIHTSNDFYTEAQLKLAEMLASICVCNKVFFCNSGAEANEAAIKLARKYAKLKSGPEKYEIITVLGSFHGRTLATITATGQPKYQKGFEPLVPGFKHVEFNDLSAMSEAVNSHTCAVMLEPVLGESGVYPVGRDYLSGVRKLCDDHHALLILDEVQTGLGRTGKMFAYEHYGIEPDIITLAKALGGGVPIGAMLAKEEVAQAFGPGDHASTFGGSALPAAVGVAALTAIQEERLVENARVVGEYFLNHLISLQKKYQQITQVRGIGMMLALDLSVPQANQIKMACFAKGLLINTVGDQMLRLVPPLVLSKEQVDQAMGIFEEILAELLT